MKNIPIQICNKDLLIQSLAWFHCPNYDRFIQKFNYHHTSKWQAKKIYLMKDSMNLQQTKLRSLKIILAPQLTTFFQWDQPKDWVGSGTEWECLSLRYCLLLEPIRSSGDFAITCPLGESWHLILLCDYKLLWLDASITLL